MRAYYLYFHDGLEKICLKFITIFGKDFVRINFVFNLIFNRVAKIGGEIAEICF